MKTKDIVKVQNYIINQASGWEEYQYSQDNKLLKILCYNGYGEMYLKQEILYDDNNNKIEFKEYEDNVIVTDIDYLYDEHGNLIEESSSLLCDFNKKIYEYDEYGYKTKETIHKCVLHDEGGDCKWGNYETYVSA